MPSFFEQLKDHADPNMRVDSTDHLPFGGYGQERGGERGRGRGERKEDWVVFLNQALESEYTVIESDEDVPEMANNLEVAD